MSTLLSLFNLPLFLALVWFGHFLHYICYKDSYVFYAFIDIMNTTSKTHIWDAIADIFYFLRVEICVSNQTGHDI